ncbi:MAG: 1-(5-phosphoribosyl)-5-[(5-phosphoribosylamino)methylideneamino]imidazole-4-carboxamide isomerase [Syntrophothermus sp.]|uniref:1-(5-phosphoribosyl)-5-[(5- phosphoribosylamino)methylideneamino]imidazole-4- carboxamide isomerase n=1 Tax=Syntrophothermus sp. TaxID=2736299 RepID=UPI00257BA9C3|nr:1-(5-phosphoribosyl)-5-[(5-phosphoribosylamino)methylideneamino]imidazole-4-carboxamide isomerase [Syntrophothermus sp.]NSW82908.1 1-(5-phosphoribosyl)-5-[(5-phosphoribosylamino)methylideneamino]imidazole-4-carboxamide isomerase [Syntrophothermus sp.]
MIIFPAIDIREGRCVRLVQGKKENEVVYSNHPARVARSFEDLGARWLHVVDLDGAFAGAPRNLKVIEEIAHSVEIPFQVGGGLRSLRDVEQVLAVGAARVVIGTKAVESPSFAQELLERFGPERIVLGLDARDGMVAVKGWVEVAEMKAVDLARSMKELGIVRAVYTDVTKDGLLQGPNFEAIEEIARTSGLRIIASGGVSSLEDVEKLLTLEELGVEGVIIGKAIYDGTIDLRKALSLVEE